MAEIIIARCLFGENANFYEKGLIDLITSYAQIHGFCTRGGLDCKFSQCIAYDQGRCVQNCNDIASNVLFDINKVDFYNNCYIDCKQLDFSNYRSEVKSNRTITFYYCILVNLEYLIIPNIYCNMSINTHINKLYVDLETKIGVDDLYYPNNLIFLKILKNNGYYDKNKICDDYIHFFVMKYRRKCLQLNWLFGDFCDNIDVIIDNYCGPYVST